MRIALCLTLSLLLGSWFETVYAQPYVAVVNTDEATVRSGPGMQYYSTQKLPTGTKVNVYRHDPGGWAAISPPANSFSWVMGKYVQVDSDEKATINADQVNARVGSQFSDIRDVIQVKLNQGQQVYIRDAKLLRVGQSGQTWYKIEPPSGEFRWIRLQDLAKEAKVEAAAPVAIQSPPDLPPAKMPTQPPVNPDEQPLKVVQDNWEPSQKTQQTSGSPSQDATVRQTTFQERLTETVEDAMPIAIPPESISPNAAEALERERELRLLSHKLSRTVTEPPKTWYFDDLYAEAETILDEAQTGHVRSLARELLQEIDRFDKVKREYRQFDLEGYTAGEMPKEFAPKTQFASQRSQPDEPTTEEVELPTKETAADDSRLDGIGRLAPLYSSEFGAPRYALLSDDGERKFYVTPGPGSKLTKYIGKEVGIIGTVSTSIDGGIPHIVAKRVLLLPE